MKRAVRFLTGLSLLLTLSACTGSGVSPPEYPAEVVDIGDSPSYPLRAAGFDRGKIVAYAPDMSDISTGYDLRSIEAQVAATIYVYNKDIHGSDIGEHFKLVKAQIERVHKGAIFLEEGTVVLEKNDQRYAALKASYQFSDVFRGQRQELYSVVLLWSHKNKYVKLRSTSPIAHRVASEQKSIELLNAVDWAY